MDHIIIVLQPNGLKVRAKSRYDHSLEFIWSEKAMLRYLLSHKLEFASVDLSRRQFLTQIFCTWGPKKSPMLRSIIRPESLSPLHKLKTFHCTYLYARILCTVALGYLLKSDLCFNPLQQRLRKTMNFKLALLHNRCCLGPRLSANSLRYDLVECKSCCVLASSKIFQNLYKPFWRDFIQPIVLKLWEWPALGTSSTLVKTIL